MQLQRRVSKKAHSSVRYHPHNGRHKTAIKSAKTGLSVFLDKSGSQRVIRVICGKTRSRHVQWIRQASGGHRRQRSTEESPNRRGDTGKCANNE